MALRLLTFPGRNGPGDCVCQNAVQGGERILQVLNLSGDTVDYTTYFNRFVQPPNPSIGSPVDVFPFVIQVINVNLSGQIFIALVDDNVETVAES